MSPRAGDQGGADQGAAGSPQSSDSPPGESAAAGADRVRAGAIQGFLAYGVWGLFPLYFHALREAGAWEILGHRILWTLLVCGIVLAVRRDWAWIKTVLRRPSLALGLTAASLLIATNWVIYILAVLSGHTYQAALGYFLNPILTVALGVLVLGEGLRRLQWIAVGIGAFAAVYLAVAAGSFPWVALSLASSFGLYGLLKNRLGVSLQPWQSLFAETAVLTPVAVVILVLVDRAGDTTYGSSPSQTTLLTLAGIITAVPLLLFAAAAQRVPLVTMGLIQFMTPVIQLLIGVILLHEHVTRELWVGFGIVWVALMVLTTDSLRAGRRARAMPPPA